MSASAAWHSFIVRLTAQHSARESSSRGSYSKFCMKFVVGTGGGDFKESPRPGVFSEKLISYHYGVLRLNLMPSSYGWQFLEAPSGKELDRGRSACRPIQRLAQ